MRVGASTRAARAGPPPNALIDGIERAPGHGLLHRADRRTARCCDAARAHDISSLRDCVSAGETLPAPTFDAWKEATGIRIIDGIGSTEMLHIFISAPGDDIAPGRHRPAGARATRRASSTTTAARCADGEIGRLAVRGPTGCRYLDDSSGSASTSRTAGTSPATPTVVDADGYFWYQARTDDMIISVRLQHLGPEVESVLLRHPAVQECGVVGAPDEERGPHREGVRRAPARCCRATPDS